MWRENKAALTLDPMRAKSGADVCLGRCLYSSLIFLIPPSLFTMHVVEHGRERRAGLRRGTMSKLRVGM